MEMTEPSVEDVIAMLVFAALHVGPQRPFVTVEDKAAAALDAASTFCRVRSERAEL